jgi:hypothetical protein
VLKPLCKKIPFSHSLFSHWDFFESIPSVDLPAPAGAVYFNPMATPWEEWITQCKVALKGQVK